MPPMPADLDIFRSAKLLIDQCGQDALLEAALKADELLDAGDLDGTRAHEIFDAAGWPDLDARRGPIVTEGNGTRPAE